jgi:hypothetical protein
LPSTPTFSALIPISSTDSESTRNFDWETKKERGHLVKLNAVTRDRTLLPISLPLPPISKLASKYASMSRKEQITHWFDRIADGGDELGIATCAPSISKSFTFSPHSSKRYPTYFDERSSLQTDSTRFLCALASWDKALCGPSVCCSETCLIMPHHCQWNVNLC